MTLIYFIEKDTNENLKGQNTNNGKDSCTNERTETAKDYEKTQIYNGRLRVIYNYVRNARKDSVISLRDCQDF